MGTAEHTLGHLRAPLGWQQRLARFTENHDEQRALAVHRGGERGALAAAVVTYLAPGLRFFHDGQFEGRRQHHSMHVGAYCCCSSFAVGPASSIAVKVSGSLVLPNTPVHTLMKARARRSRRTWRC